MNYINELEALLEERKRLLPEKSYTANLFRDGRDRILKKIGEEAGELIIAAKNDNRQEFTHEAADLFFHILVLCVNENVAFEDIIKELELRHR